MQYGEFIKQDYFRYDSSYIATEYNVLTSVLRPDMAPTNWFADTTYVGEIIASFYTNSAGVVIDDTNAEIKVTLGSVAVYPGYYSTNDGFVSDEMYIQDNNYYQQFSYVVRVEEQLENYKDIIKSLLQPVGLKLFGEYYIYKNFDVTASPLLAFVRRQFSDQITQFGDFEINSISKLISDTYISESNYAEEYIKNVVKSLSESQALSENITKNVSKQITQEVINAFVENVIKNVTKVLADTQATSDSTSYSATKQIAQEVINAFVENVIKNGTKQITQEVINTFTENVIKNSTKQIAQETQAIAELAVAKSFTPETKTDTIGSLIENIIKVLTKQIDDSITSVTQSDGKSLDWSSGVGGTFYQTVNLAENTFERTVTYNRDPDDSAILGEVLLKYNITSLKTDAFTPIDSFGRVVTYSRSVADSNVIFAELDFKLERVILLSDAFSSSESYGRVITFKRDFNETQSVSEQAKLLFTPPTIEESMSLVDGTFTLGTLFTRSFADSINSFIEGSTLYVNAYSETTTTANTTDDYFSEVYAVVSTISIT